MFTKSIVLLTLLGAVSLITSAQELTFREYAKTHGISNQRSAITLNPPPACTLYKQHPCVYYGGDLNAYDPEENGLSNENTLFISNSFTYTEVNVPIRTTIYGSFSNNLCTYGVIDPRTATWFYRTGVSEGNGGTQICSGDTPATLTATGSTEFLEYEVLTQTPCTVPAGDVWFAVTPNCTNPNDPDCTNDPRYFEADTNGLNAINGQYTVTSNKGLGPTFDSAFFGYTFASWCNDLGVACGDGMSAGVLK